MSLFCFGQVLSFTRNLAGLVRQNFLGVPISDQGQSAVPSLSTGNNPNVGQVYNFNVVLLDPRGSVAKTTK